MTCIETLLQVEVRIVPQRPPLLNGSLV